uniref:RNase H type-1 domain-containing protein n=1 Tax=Cannabis sativa TaxID=3483 RepID=A0A803QPG6_CANSA
MQANQFNGIFICRFASSISHLLFADDSLFFTTINPHNCRAIKDILNTYNKSTGQSVNFAKSSVLFSRNTSSQDRVFFNNFLGIILPFLGEAYYGEEIFFVKAFLESAKLLEVIVDLATVALDEFLAADFSDMQQRLGLRGREDLGEVLEAGCRDLGPSFVASFSSRWVPPEPSILVLSIDAAVTPVRGFAGFGGVVRDVEGVVWMAWSIGCAGEFQVVMAELLAVRISLLWASNLGFKVGRMETDASTICNWINNPNSNVEFKLVTEEIISLLAAVGDGSCCAISRVANGVAHTLAKNVTSLLGVHV